MEENKELNEDMQVEEVTSEMENEVEAMPENAEEVVVEEKVEDKAAEYLDRLQRLMAEFDNFRKRSEKEKSDAYDYAVSNTVVELLPVIDNFERALKVETADQAFHSGVSMIYKQFMGILENLKVTPIEAEGQAFNPNLHNAIMHIDDEAYGENTVAEELQKGYLYKEKVIRHSMVKVAN